MAVADEEYEVKKEWIIIIIIPGDKKKRSNFIETLKILGLVDSVICKNRDRYPSSTDRIE